MQEREEKTSDSDSKVATRAYAHNAPKILLEVLSARTTLAILVTTYVVFGVAFYYDVRSTIKTFSDGDRYLTSSSCEEFGITPNNMWTAPGEWGCTYDNGHSKSWLAHVGNMTNVISIALKAQSPNITSGNANATIPPPNEYDDYIIQYDVSLYACFQNDRCKKTSTSHDRATWLPVLKTHHQRLSYAEIFTPLGTQIDMTLIGNMFQNQESLPTKGKVKSYLVQVDYTKDYYEVIPHYDITYDFLSISRPNTPYGDILRPLLLGITILSLILYLRAVYTGNPNISKWLHERKWIVIYFLALICYINPVYCVICWMNNPNASVVYWSYILDSLSQAAFFTIWLLFADGLRRKSEFYTFYVPKVAVGALIFIVDCFIITLQFPSLNPATERSAVLSVNNWSYGTKILFVVLSLVLLLSLFVWSIWWFITLYVTGKRLRTMPYMNTRYLQLSFRFFLLQATLVAIYYTFEYFIIAYFILRNSPPRWNENPNNIADNINTLFRHQTQLVGKVVFLTVYSMILAFLFMPANYMETHSMTTLTATYAIYEYEQRQIVRSRRKAMAKVKAISNLAHAKAEIFCVEIALSLLDASYEAYYDQRDMETPSGFGPSDLSRHGYELIDHMYHEECDTYCYIARHTETQRVVVAFRGSCSRKHWQGNLKYGLKEINMHALPMQHVDDGDNLAAGGFLDLETVRQLEAEWHNGVDDEAWATEESELHEERSVTGTLKDIATTVVGATTDAVVGATTSVVGATTGILTAAVAHTPGMKITVNTYIHSGFWESYEVVRTFIHTVLRRELSARPSHVYFTGHSLGGALATHAALDFSIHSVMRLRKYLRYRDLCDHRDGRITHLRNDHRRICVSMYNFGSPKVGNWAYAQFYDKLVPDSFRTVVDGDIVVGVPPLFGYSHVGTQVLIDPIGAGSIIIDPSFVERRLRTSVKSSITAHTMSVYSKGLLGVRHAAEYIQRFGSLNDSDHQIDMMKLSLMEENILRKPVAGEHVFDPLPIDSQRGDISMAIGNDISVHSTAASEISVHDDIDESRQRRPSDLEDGVTELFPVPISDIEPSRDYSIYGVADRFSDAVSSLFQRASMLFQTAVGEKPLNEQELNRIMRARMPRRMVSEETDDEHALLTGSSDNSNDRNSPKK